MSLVVASLPASDVANQLGHLRVAREAQRHQLTVRQLFDRRLQVGRQDAAQAEAHLEPDHAILHAQRLYARQERQAEQRRRHDSLPREVRRRFPPQVAERRSTTLMSSTGTTK